MRAVCLAMLVAGPVAADGWVALEGPDLRAALAARVLAWGDGTTQNFFQDGRTLYEGGASFWGIWRVVGRHHCSNWPPSDLWACFTVARQARGLDLRFTSRDGAVVMVGRYVDLR